MNKVYPSAREALAGIVKDGVTLGEVKSKTAAKLDVSAVS